MPPEPVSGAPAAPLPAYGAPLPSLLPPAPLCPSGRLPGASEAARRPRPRVPEAVAGDGRRVNVRAIDDHAATAVAHEDVNEGAVNRRAVPARILSSAAATAVGVDAGGSAPQEVGEAARLRRRPENEHLNGTGAGSRCRTEDTDRGTERESTGAAQGEPEDEEQPASRALEGSQQSTDISHQPSLYEGHHDTRSQSSISLLFLSIFNIFS